MRERIAGNVKSFDGKKKALRNRAREREKIMLRNIRERRKALRILSVYGLVVILIATVELLYLLEKRGIFSDFYSSLL